MRLLSDTHVVLWQLQGSRTLSPAAREAVEQVGDLPMHHRDPFDRLLIAQARSERLTIVTADRRFAAYDVPLVDAG